MLFAVGVIVFVIIALSALAVVPFLLPLFQLQSLAVTLESVGRWPLLAIIVAATLEVLYRYESNRAVAKVRWISKGSIIATIAWLAFLSLFSWYVSNLADFNETFGSLGAVIALMTWMWLSTTIVLLGAELNAEIEPQTKEDTTTGPAQPMGRRDAQMADTVGEARAD